MTTALITGASGGIGLDLAALMAAEGTNLILVARSGDKLKALAEQLRERHGVQVDVVVQDLSEPASVKALMQSVGERDIGVLVNNAGRGDFGLFQAIEPERHLEMMRLNMMALTELTQAVLPRMLKQGHGQIVNIASVVAFQPMPWMAVYGASKAFVLSLSEALAFELRSTGVKVLAICPGPTRTGFTAAARAAFRPAVERNMALSQAVAAYTLRKIRQGRGGVGVHGLLNRITTTLTPLLPRKLVLAVTERVMRT